MSQQSHLVNNLLLYEQSSHEVVTNLWDSNNEQSSHEVITNLRDSNNQNHNYLSHLIWTHAIWIVMIIRYRISRSQLLFIKQLIQEHNGDIQSQGRRSHMPTNRGHNITLTFLRTIAISTYNLQIFQMLMINLFLRKK